MTDSEKIVSEAIKGVCVTCHKIVPAENVERDGKIFLRKNCPDCGSCETLVSADAANWRAKRQLVGYDPCAPEKCALNCQSCKHGQAPTMVFVDVTNRCNMNCPICLANLTAMGFEFDPPMEYFDKIFKRVAQFERRPAIQLFGGEPTVRKDLVEIIELAASYGLSARVTTNGLALANEEYCNRLLDTNTQLMFSLDGRSPEIYERLRKHPTALERKLEALENVRRHGNCKVTIMSAIGWNVNDHAVADLVQMCHDYRGTIVALDMIPLTESWGNESAGAEDNTVDDVEEIFRRAMPGAEFLPAAALQKIPNIERELKLRLTFGGAHPNCESVTILVSDGEKYVPLSNFLKVSMKDLAEGLMALDEKLGRRFENGLLSKMFGATGRKIQIVTAMLGFFRKAADLRKIFVDHPAIGALKMAWGLAKGEKIGKLLGGPLTRLEGILRVIVLPFEEPGSIDNRRLADCPASFAFENPRTREIDFMPVCAWCLHKDEILRVTTERYGTVRKPLKEPEPANV